MEFIYFTDSGSIACSLCLDQSATCYEFIYWCGQLLWIWIREYQLSFSSFSLADIPPYLYYCSNSLSQLTTSSSPLACSCLLSSFCKLTVWPWTSPLSFPRFQMTLDGPFQHLYPPSCNPHLIPPNLFYPSTSACAPRCDLCDISTVTPVTLHRGRHCPPCRIQGREAPLM